MQLLMLMMIERMMEIQVDTRQPQQPHQDRDYVGVQVLLRGLGVVRLHPGVANIVPHIGLDL